MKLLRRDKGRQFAQTIRRFNALLADLAANRLLSLFLEIIHETENQVDSNEFFRRRPDRIKAYRREMLSLGDAINDGDEVAAVVAANHCVELNLKWIAEDNAGGRRPGMRAEEGAVPRWTYRTGDG
nr:FCD domain-containing protein [Rhizorhabdus sp.]